MLCTTTSTIPGKSITLCLGLVAGEAVLGGNVLRDLAASVRDVTGGRVSSSESLISQAREAALRDMCERARKVGAHAIVGVRVEIDTLGDSGSMLLAQATGTAVCTELAPAVQDAGNDGEQTAYIVQVGGAEKGPFSLEQVRELAVSGRIGPEVQVRADGDTDWQTVAELLA